MYGRYRIAIGLVGGAFKWFGFQCLYAEALETRLIVQEVLLQVSRQRLSASRTRAVDEQPWSPLQLARHELSLPTRAREIVAESEQTARPCTRTPGPA